MLLDHKQYFNTSISDILGLFGLAKQDLNRRRAIELVEEYAVDSIEYYKLWKDKSFYFQDSVNGFLAYRNFDNLSVVLGDPLAEQRDIPVLINGFKQEALAKKLKPCFFSTSNRYLDFYKKAGFKTIKIGHEVIVDIQNFDLGHASKQELRERLRQLDSFRYKVRHYKKPTDAKLLQDLKRVSDEWLATGQEEKKFALGAFDFDYIKSSTVMTVEDVAGNVIAFATLLPSGKSRELNVDMLRQAPAISVEALEFLIAYTILFFKELDYEKLNLGMIPSLIKDSDIDNNAVVQKALMRKMHCLFVQPDLINIKKNFADKLRSRHFNFL